MRELVLQRLARAAKAGGPPALITAALGVGSTGVAGRGIEAKTAPVARGAADAVGVSSELGPVLLLLAAALVVVVAFVVPGVFEEHPA